MEEEERSVRSFKKPKSEDNILQWFREGYTPRDLQTKVLKEVEECWDWADVILIRADVGAGKSLMADCISRWHYNKHGAESSIIMPNNALVQQYKGNFPEMETIGHKNSYGDRGWGEARAKFTQAPVKLANFYTYLAHRAYSPLLIVDESHTLIDTLLDFDGVKIWKHLTPYPPFRNILDVIEWSYDYKDVDKKIGKLHDILKRKPEEYTMKLEVCPYRGHDREVLKVIPLTPRNNKPFFWPARVKKIIMMSATIGVDDLYEFGLDKRKVKIIDGGSPIPKENRPIKYDPVANFTFYNQETSVPALMERIAKYAERHKGQKGMVHTTYAMARVMRRFMLPSLKDKMMFHNMSNKARVLSDFIASPPEDGKILVGCGMAEGIDLKDDLCRWQVISKIQYPNKSDIAVAEKLKLHPQWYMWEAVKHLEQARGRVVRSESDFGITYLTDRQFERLYNGHTHLFSEAFREALI